jgi:ketosteroid isomerase-like protein
MTPSHSPVEEVAVRKLLQDWAAAVRRQDRPAILAHHSPDILMFDVPPPLESRGLAAYSQTWDLFYSAQPLPVAFDIVRMEVVAGADVGFATALMRCAENGPDGKRQPLDFRLTVGLSKVNGEWTVLHEHHSVPAL